jgi:serine protease Do
MSLLSVFAVSAQKGATAVPSEEEESTEEATDILTLPILLDGEARELTLDGTTGAVLAVFNASEGDVVDISMTSNDIDPFIVILDENGVPVAMNDDSEGLNSLVEGFEVPADGSYFILATTFLGSFGEEETDGGDFELLVEGNTMPAGLDDDSFSYMVYTIEVGEEYDLEIDEEIPLYLAEFYGEAGQQVTFDAPSDELDTLMMLFDINGNRIAVDDDSGDDPLAAHIETELPADGLYLLIVTTYDYDRIADGADVTDGLIAFSSH